MNGPEHIDTGFAFAVVAVAWAAWAFIAKFGPKR